VFEFEGTAKNTRQYIGKCQCLGILLYNTYTLLADYHFCGAGKIPSQFSKLCNFCFCLFIQFCGIECILQTYSSNFQVAS